MSGSPSLQQASSQSPASSKSSICSAPVTGPSDITNPSLQYWPLVIKPRLQQVWPL